MMRKSADETGGLTRLDEVNFRWLFDARVGRDGNLSKSDIIDDLIDKFASKPDELLKLVRATGNPSLVNKFKKKQNLDLDAFLNEDLKTLLNKIIEVNQVLEI